MISSHLVEKKHKRDLTKILKNLSKKYLHTKLSVTISEVANQ